MLLGTVGHVTSMVKALQGMGFDIPTPRLVFTGSNKSGVRTVAESVMGMKLIPYNLCHPFEIHFVHVAGKVDIVCRLNFNQTRYIFPGDAWSFKRDTEQHVKTLSDSTDERIIMTVESSQVPDMHVLQSCTTDVSQIESFDIAVFVIAANNVPSEDVLQSLKTSSPPFIGVLTKLDMVDLGMASKMLWGNSLSLPFGLIGFVYDKQVGSDWLAKHPVYSTFPPELRGVEAITKKVGLEMKARYVEILKRMQGDLDRKKASLGERLAVMGESKATNEETEERNTVVQQLKTLEDVEKFVA